MFLKETYTYNVTYFTSSLLKLFLTSHTAKEKSLHYKQIQHEWTPKNTYGINVKHINRDFSFSLFIIYVSLSISVRYFTINYSNRDDVNPAHDVH